MEAVLYVSHGTRVPDGVKEATRFIQSCIEQVELPIQEICFLELVKPDIQEGIRRCVEKGATRIIVQPVLLLTAGHVKQDIPLELDKAQAEYPGVTLVLSEALGVDDLIIDLLIKRIHEAPFPFTRGSSMVLLVGRGSSDPDTKEDFSRIAVRLEEKGCGPVFVSYLASAKPSFPMGIEHAKTQGYPNVFVVPYLMFTGLLMREMDEKIASLPKYPVQFYLCDSLGPSPELTQVLLKRVTTYLGAQL